jgi:hypothetical protein
VSELAQAAAICADRRLGSSRVARGRSALPSFAINPYVERSHQTPSTTKRTSRPTLGQDIRAPRGLVDEQETPGSTGDLPDLGERSDAPAKRFEGCESERPADPGSIRSGPEDYFGRVAEFLSRASVGATVRRAARPAGAPAGSPRGTDRDSVDLASEPYEIRAWNARTMSDPPRTGLVALKDDLVAVHLSSRATVRAASRQVTSTHARTPERDNCLVD